MNTLHTTISAVEHIPTAGWIALALANVVVMILSWRVARRRLRRLGERAAHPDRFVDRTRKRDVTLTVASLVPAALFWGMVLAGSFRGLVAFGSNVLDWNGGAEYLVPGTLDGVSVTFAFLAFRAIHKQRDPRRSQRVVWAASLSSATVNFAYEYGSTHHNLIAAFYLAVLSLFGMVIFHEFLAQFEEGAEYARRSKRPAWGLRWITSPYSTFCAAVAWENFPPDDATTPTVLNGLANLQRARDCKRAVADARAANRHMRALAAAQRSAELLAAKADTDPLPAAPADQGTDVERVAVPEQETVTPSTVARSRRRARPDRPHVQRTTAPTADEMKVPATAATLMQWAEVWVRMRANGDATGPLDDDQRARAVYELSARQLRNIRNAARSGALARKAHQLEMVLPEGYVDGPSDQAHDRRKLADVAA